MMKGKNIMKELISYLVKLGISRKAAETAVHCRYNLWHSNGEIGRCVLTKEDLEIFGDTKAPRDFSPLLIA